MNGDFFLLLLIIDVSGSHSAFKKVYEEPIVQSRQPDATTEEKDIGERRAEEVSGESNVCIHVHSLVFKLTQCIQI